MHQTTLLWVVRYVLCKMAQNKGKQYLTRNAEVRARADQATKVPRVRVPAATKQDVQNVLGLQAM